MTHVATSTKIGASDAAFYIKEGKVTLTVVSKTEKKATIGILNVDDFFGEGCVAGQRSRVARRLR
ncbi:MAG TPA: hypothetical protein VNO32_52555 [Candidatus Acidoferrum sp.]|nr:hypothetical protein [Candidatus Acidoferrum sp.]